MVNREHPSNETTANALTESNSRFQAIVSNIPGLVFQLKMLADQSMHFVYLSEGCEALLGMTPEELNEDANQFFSIMNAYDRNELRKKMQETAHNNKRLDWEGRVWIDGWQDTKWINMRATTRKLSNGLNNVEVQWDGIMFNITQSKIEKQQIEQSKRDLQQLSAHMSHVKEQERLSIAREIHDDLGGNLTAIKMGLSSIGQQISNGQPVALEQTAALEAIVNSTFEAVHRISGNLRPNILELGIVDAIEWQVNQFKKQVKLDTSFTCNVSDVELSEDQSAALFRICQEALSNIAKYAKASSVKVDLISEDDHLMMIIEDNGIGISDADKIKLNSYGLRGMQERVMALSGEINVGVGENEKGTKIVVVIPL